MELEADKINDLSRPNIDDPNQFNRWLDRWVRRPLKGFEDITHPDGKPYSFVEQIEATKQQLRNTAEDFKLLKINPDKTVEVIVEVVKGLRQKE